MSADPKKITLTVLQRYTLAKILPAEGEFWDMRSVKRLRDMLKTMPAEQSKFGVHENPLNGSLTFDDDRKAETFLSTEATFKFHPAGLKVIREALRKLDKEKKMAADELVPLFEKFIPEDELKAEEPLGERCEEVLP